MKKISLISAFLIAIITLKGQEAKVDSLNPWKTAGSVSVNFNNTSLTNWAAGGQSSVSLGAILDLQANYNKGKNQWVNTLNWAAGASRIGDNSNLIKKSDDLMVIFSKYRRNVNDNWGFAAFAEARTQVFKSNRFAVNTDTTETGAFANGKNEVRTSDYLSSLLSPGYLTTSIGWEYNKGQNFYIHATPLSGRGTFVADDRLAGVRPSYGLDSTQRVNFQFGALVRSGFKMKVMENVDFSSTLQLFSPYEKFGNIDVTWETLTSFKINKFYQLLLQHNYCITMILDQK